MTYDELLAKYGDKSKRKPSRDEEHQIQVACVNWFRVKHRKRAHNLFSVPNGGRRDAVTGAKLKAEGALAGVADLILLYPNTQYHALLIEMKTRKGRQSDAQKEWQTKIEKDGYKYVVCRSLDDFIRTIEEYLNT